MTTFPEGVKAAALRVSGGGRRYPRLPEEHVANIWGADGDESAAARPRRLLVARHGETEWNARGVWQGQRDVPLSDHGRAQAAALAERIAGEGVTALWTSDLSRARETAEIVGTRIGLAPCVTPLLREIDVGAWEGLGPDEIAARDPRIVAAMARGEDPPRGGTGESVAAFQARVVRGFEEACDGLDGGTLLLVVHGGVNKVLIGHLLGVPRANTGRITSGGNASVGEILFGPHGPQLVRLNDTRHLGGAGTPPPDAA